MNCDQCNSQKILSINAKCSDLFDMTYNGKSGSGYVPTNLPFGSKGYGDYVEMSFCLDCGKIQGHFPISEKSVNQALSKLNGN